ncbi:MAG TPA: multidrug effflux MFS transporter [Steroidobacteraceae bacterium]|jgi:DHA1 family bicyclomycin/chloramphenicol resistance-like MFS transporter
MDRLLARRLIFASAAIGSLGTFAMHAILPALPEIRSQFASSVSTAQLLVTLSMLAIASGNVMVAPLSDRFGRRPLIFAGLSLFIAGSLAGMLANSIALLIGARIVQAFGSGAAMAVARATLMDAFGPERAATGIAYTATAILVVPMVAPTIGGFAVEIAGWRLVFALCIVLGTAVLIFTSLRIKETHTASTATRSGPDTIESYRELLRTGRYRAYALFGSLLFAAVYVFIAGAPHVAIDVLHISPSHYGLLFMLPAAASFAGFFTAARLSRRMGALRMMRAGSLLSLTGGLLLTLFTLLHVWHPAALFLPAMLVCFANAISAPNATSSAIGVRPDIAGAASGLTGFLQLIVSATAVQLVAAISNPSPYPLAFTVFGCNVLALLVFILVQRRTAAHAATIVLQNSVVQTSRAAPPREPPAPAPTRTHASAGTDDRQGQLF